MAVTYSRAGPTLTVTITQDVSDLVGAPGTKDAKIIGALQRCDDQLQQLMQAHQVGTINAQIAGLQAQKAALPTPIAGF